MKNCLRIAVAICTLTATFDSVASQLDGILRKENEAQGNSRQPAPLVDDLTFLRRVSVDLIGRIPTMDEIHRFESLPHGTRRSLVVEKLLKDPRFADRWTTFYADMFRARSNVDGGAALIAFLHRSLEQNMSYDELARRLMTTNGKAGSTPEVGFVLGDDADPMALASATAQVFMGVRMGCAQCHDHPFDVWKRKDFYGLAAFFGKTRRITSNLTRVVYTTESDQTSVLWPPEDDAGDGIRRPMKPRFPIELAQADRSSRYIARLESLRSRQAELTKAKNSPRDADIDDLLALTDKKLDQRINNDLPDKLAIDADARGDLRKIDIQAGLYRPSELRTQLASFVTSPRNRYFSGSFVNRVWAELIGRGFVEPVDDFSEVNPPSHPATLDYLSDEFVANGYDLRTLVRLIVTSEIYQRAHFHGRDEQLQTQMEDSFLATPMRRVLAESIFDSIVTAGHLFEVKHKAGQNQKIYYETIRFRKEAAGDSNPRESVDPIATPNRQMARSTSAAGAGYKLEESIELDFDKLLTAAQEDVAIDQMKVMSAEELEAMRMQQRASTPRGSYVEKQVKRVYDDNPRFSSAFRMASPAPAGHFLRVFGQPSRSQLGELRDRSPSMRQALLILNGRLTHEASRVGELEPMHELLTGREPDLDQAIRLAYLEILTRTPTAAELAEGREIVSGADELVAGMQDLRWVLLNCNEFRYLR